MPILALSSVRNASKSDAKKVPYRSRRWSSNCWHDIATRLTEKGSLSSFLSASGKLLMMVFSRLEGLQKLPNCVLR